MTTKSSTGLVNAMLASGSFKSVMDAGSEIRVFSGTEPASADDATGAATLLVTFKNGSSGVTMASSAADGVLVKNPAETWTGTAVASGMPTFYRHVLTADSNGLSTTAPRQQGSCGIAGADMNFTNGALTASAVETLNFYSTSLPKQ